MKSKWIIKLILLFTLLISGGILNKVSAQKTVPEEQQRKYTIAVQPFYLVNGGLRLDFEKQLSNKRDWLQFSVTGFYLKDKGDYYDAWWNMNTRGHNNNYYYDSYLDSYLGSQYTDYDEIEKLTGGSIGVGYKRFFTKMIYFSGNLSYTYYNVGYYTSVLHKFEEEGNTFLRPSYAMAEQTFHKINPSLTLGLQTPLRYGLFLDFYLGVGYTYSFYDEGKRSYNENVYSYGYRGINPVGGIRVGYAFGKYQ